MGKRKVLTEKELKDTPLPATGQLLGIVKKLLGNDRAQALCTDMKMRTCRIKGKLRRRVWIRIGDTVLIELWGFQDDTRGDIVGRYTAAQKEWLRQNGYLPDWMFA
ncbi:MAG: translation initiation factor eIF-1A [Candidatus Geothermarchaeales archaeon]